MKRREVRPEAGFTLIELLIAVAVFALGAVVLSSVVVSNMQKNRLSKEISEATTLAERKIEELRNGLTPPTGGSDTLGLYTRTWTSQTNSPVAGAYDVSVNVAWQDLGNRSVRMRTIVIR